MLVPVQGYEFESHTSHYARMSKLVKETDLKSVGVYPLEGSIPSSRIYALVAKLANAAVLNTDWW